MKISLVIPLYKMVTLGLKILRRNLHHALFERSAHMLEFL